MHLPEMESQHEEWLPVDSAFDPLGAYDVSSLGRVRRRAEGPLYFRTERILKCCKDTKGYPLARLSQGSNVFRSITVHKLVARAFIGPRPYGLQINHRDGKKWNNRVDNLEYITCAENIRHAVRLGLNTPTQGEKNRHAKLDRERVVAIRSEVNYRNYEELGLKYSVDEATISRVRSRRTWRHI
jgi:hypothetical protein